MYGAIPLQRKINQLDFELRPANLSVTEIYTAQSVEIESIDKLYDIGGLFTQLIDTYTVSYK